MTWLSCLSFEKAGCQQGLNSEKNNKIIMTLLNYIIIFIKLIIIKIIIIIIIIIIFIIIFHF